MKLDDSQHFLLISTGVLALPCYVSVLLWRDYKWVRPLFRYSIVAVLAVFSYAMLMHFAPDSFPVKMAITASTLAGFFCVWRIVCGLGFKLLSDLSVAAVALIILPVMFSHNSELVALSLQGLVGATIPTWVGYLLLGALVLVVAVLVRLSRVHQLVKVVAVVYVASSLVFIAIRLAMIEGPAPDFKNTELVCFESEVYDRCPVGLEDPVATAALLVFIALSLLVVYRRTICCQKKKQNGYEKAPLREAAPRHRKKKKKREDLELQRIEEEKGNGADEDF